MAELIKLTPSKKDVEFVDEDFDEDDEDIDVKSFQDYDQDVKERLFSSKFADLLYNYEKITTIWGLKKLLKVFDDLEDDVRVHAVHLLASLGLDALLTFLSKMSDKFDVDVEDSCQRTPLYTATQHGQFKTIMTLIQLGADIHHVDKFGRSFIHMTCFANLTFTKKLYKYTIEHPECGFKFDFDNPVEELVPCMIQEGTLAKTKWLIEDVGCSVDTVDSSGHTALYYTCLFYDNPKKVLYLIEHGAQPCGFSENAFKLVNDRLKELREQQKKEGGLCSVELAKQINVLEKFFKKL